MAQFASTLYPQTNPTNPILLDIRVAYTAGYSFVKLAAVFSKHVYYRGCFVTTDWQRITDPAQIDHARRILSRLAALSG